MAHPSSLLCSQSCKTACLVPLMKVNGQVHPFVRRHTRTDEEKTRQHNACYWNLRAKWPRIRVSTGKKGRQKIATENMCSLSRCTPVPPWVDAISYFPIVLAREFNIAGEREKERERELSFLLRHNGYLSRHAPPKNCVVFATADSAV